MKGGGGGGSGASAYGFPAKRRWKGLVIGVLGLVFLSMLVPLVFLLGLYNGFHTTGYASDSQSSKPGFQPSHVDDIIRKLGPTLPKDVFQPNAIEPKKEVEGFIDESRETKESTGLQPPKVEEKPQKLKRNLEKLKRNLQKLKRNLQKLTLFQSIPMKMVPKLMAKFRLPIA
ncbi:putative galacturonosyltransferase 7, partial [Cucurbita argyrosperma subsp. sororia]